VDAGQVPRIWRLNQNWTYIIIGGVILVAVVLDQTVHLVQQKRRIKAAGAAAEAREPTAPKPSGVEPAGAAPPPNP
jgi:ribose transport system permease protein